MHLYVNNATAKACTVPRGIVQHTSWGNGMFINPVETLVCHDVAYLHPLISTCNWPDSVCSVVMYVGLQEYTSLSVSSACACLHVCVHEHAIITHVPEYWYTVTPLMWTPLGEEKVSSEKVVLISGVKGTEFVERIGVLN